jgi:hypothetical protein
MKKFLAYSVIIIVLIAAAFFANEIMRLNEYGRHPEPERGNGGAPQAAPRGGAAFAEPASSGPMNSSELSWMLREKLTLDVMERMVTGGFELEAYNDRARKYNSLAFSIEYRESDMLQAERAVQESKGEIAREAVASAIGMSMPLKVRNDARASVVWQVQKFLGMLGYYPGAADGTENDGTVSAVKMFEIRSGGPATGRIDERLAESLREIWIASNIPASVGIGK